MKTDSGLVEYENDHLSEVSTIYVGDLSYDVLFDEIEEHVDKLESLLS